MDAKKCDRCGGFYCGNLGLKVSGNTSVITNIDLCPNCFTSFQNWKKGTDMKVVEPVNKTNIPTPAKMPKCFKGDIHPNNCSGYNYPRHGENSEHPAPDCMHCILWKDYDEDED